MRIACERHVRGELRCTWYLLPPADFEVGSDEQRNPRRRQKRKDRHDSEPMRGCAWRHVWLERLRYGHANVRSRVGRRNARPLATGADSEELSGGHFHGLTIP